LIFSYSLIPTNFSGDTILTKGNSDLIAAQAAIEVFPVFNSPSNKTE